MNDKVQRVQIEPERMGWARLADLVRLKHTEKVTDMKEDIDTLLVFVSINHFQTLLIADNIIRPVYFLL